MPIDYSKWKTIEVSDDEDDTHPNIDTPSLFRWRHQARVLDFSGFNCKNCSIDHPFDIHIQLERMAELEQAKKDVAEEKEKVKSRTQVCQNKFV